MKAFKLASMFLLASMVLVSLSYAQYGYGTSNITLSQYNVTLVNGGIFKISYSVNLVSGNTWGTTIGITNASALLSDGVSTTLSKTYANPPYTGNLTINVADSAPKGVYKIILNATGDDPASNVTIFTLAIVAAGATSTLPATTTIAAPTTVASTVPTTTVTQPAPVVQEEFLGLTESLAELLFGIIATIVIAGMLMFVFKRGPARLDIWGVAFIVIGTIIWLYADFSAGGMAYLWTGVGVLLLGVVVWLVGDGMAGAFKKPGKPAALLAAGLILIIAGMAIWLYADYHAGALSYIWSGVGLIALGTVIWAAGNALGGAFKRHAKK